MNGTIILRITVYFRIFLFNSEYICAGFGEGKLRERTLPAFLLIYTNLISLRGNLFTALYSHSIHGRIRTRTHHKSEGSVLEIRILIVSELLFHIKPPVSRYYLVIIGEAGNVIFLYPLRNEGLEYSRRSVALIDDAYAKQLLLDAGSFLVDQVNPDGSFLYGIYPRFDNEIENYNILRHASTIWSLICLWRVTGDDSLQAVADSAINYMRNYIRYEDADTAYLYEEKADEIKLGGNGVAVIAMTEYMDAFGSDKYRDDCRALGNGILRMFDPENGEFYHVLNGDFSRKEEYRTVYYDGEATFALCRLYALTGEQLWLDAAKAAVNHFIEADYTQYRDHWIAYSMNEITRFVDDPDYYDFALRNAQDNLEEIYNRETTYHTYLELLMSTFELYDRMAENGIRTDYMENTFSVEDLLRTIYARTDRMLNGFFFPEYAMYMRNPSRILNTFMVRQDGYRVRIDDVQHNIGGFYKYYVNYDRLVKYGMLQDIGK